MGKVIGGMTTSLDGFVSDRHGSVERLYPDFEALRQSESLQAQMRATGAVVMGRRSYDMGEGDFTGYEFQVPIFVLTHHPPERPARGENERLSFTFVTDGIESAVRQARAAAGGRDVVVGGGADTTRQCLHAGLLDELHVDVRALLLSEGLRLFEGLGAEPIELEVIEATTSPGLVHLKFRVAGL